MGQVNGGPIDLSAARLRRASLRFATLSGANLQGADLSGVDLTDAASADPATLQKLQELGEKFSDPKYQEASKNVETWAEENCSSE